LQEETLMRPRVVALSLISVIVVSITAVALIPVAAVTLFRARRLYAGFAARTARLILWVWGVQMLVHQDRPFPNRQTVFVSNHTSTLDLFMLVAMGLPKTRFFLSGFVRKYVPLGLVAQLMGTFFTVPQSQPEKRRQIFQRADRILRRTGESVYLSPEGGRITTGEIGPFNRGAFHLATSLRAPIVPLFFRIPRTIDPGLGFNPRPGTVHVHVMPAIETSRWRVEDVVQNKEQVRQLFVTWQRFGVHHHVESISSSELPTTALAV
jgi:1-acyl-sn-glycerol-3-phosphate acyltransferase